MEHIEIVIPSRWSLKINKEEYLVQLENKIKDLRSTISEIGREMHEYQEMYRQLKGLSSAQEA